LTTQGLTRNTPVFVLSVETLIGIRIASMKRITITIEESIYDKLPKYGKSGAINVILKHHYQKEGIDQLYETIKRKLMKDKDMNDWITITAREA